MLSGLFSPKREITRPDEKVVRSSEGTLAQARKPPGVSVLSGVLSPRREIFRPSEEVFSPRREYFRSGKNRPCSLDYFRPSDKFFAQTKGIFAQAKLVSPKLKKKKIFFFDLLFLNV